VRQAKKRIVGEIFSLFFGAADSLFIGMERANFSAERARVHLAL
jgi:hypothetical protein